jgi:hypothetical protein
MNDEADHDAAASGSDHEEPAHDTASGEAYDPADPQVPAQSPPLRSTAPQSPFTFGQVTTGFGVLAAGLVLTFGLALLLA